MYGRNQRVNYDSASLRIPQERPDSGERAGRPVAEARIAAAGVTVDLMAYPPADGRADSADDHGAIDQRGRDRLMAAPAGSTTASETLGNGEVRPLTADPFVRSGDQDREDPDPDGDQERNAGHPSQAVDLFHRTEDLT